MEQSELQDYKEEQHDPLVYKATGDIGFTGIQGSKGDNGVTGDKGNTKLMG
jgi:hypothetical protein